jgi:hypothetical protein
MQRAPELPCGISGRAGIDFASGAGLAAVVVVLLLGASGAGVAAVAAAAVLLLVASEGGAVLLSGASGAWCQLWAWGQMRLQPAAHPSAPGAD